MASGFKMLAQQLNYIRTFLSPIYAQVRIPGGFPYEAFDGRGKVKPWSILSIIDSSRVYLLTTTSGDPDRSYIDAHRFPVDLLPFIVSLKLDVSPSMYDTALQKAPLVVDSKLVNVGNSSLVLAHDVIHPEVAEPLARCRIQNVYVSKKTRRPEKLPETFREKYLPFCENGERLVLPEVVKPATEESVFSLEVEVFESETDPNLHTNYMSYLRYCINALSVVRHTGSSRTGLRVCGHDVRSASLYYMNESNIGDKLSVSVWNDLNDDKNINFEICRISDRARLFQSTIELYDNYTLHF